MADHDAARVVLLARAGEARDHLNAALVEVGAEIVLVADPTSTEPAAIAAAQPQAVLVALEPAVEDALERFETVFADPALTVIFDEAELAARRTGWDAARWARHLTAKLHRHDDVLPAGWDVDGDWQPVPGALPPAAPQPLDIAAFADEAKTLASDVPRDEGLDVSVALEPTTDLELAPANEDVAASDATEGDFGGLQLVDADALFATLDSTPSKPVTTRMPAFDEDDFDSAVSLPATDDAAGLSIGDDDLRLSLDDDALSPDAPGVEAEDIELRSAIEALALDDEAADGAADDMAVPGEPGEPATPAFESTLSLVDDTGDAATTHAPAAIDPDTEAPASATTFARDLDALEQRASALSLADTDSYGHGPARGVVWIEGGLGAPDAVRQLLGALPESFPRPIVVRLHLDGGRYDRLVKQMGRASKLSVALAEAGQTAEAGTVYFLPPELSLEVRGAGVAFAAVPVGDAPFASLPEADSALLMLSGSDVALVPAATTRMAARGLLAAQAPDSCYDAAAATALIAGGSVAGTPAELAARLVERWPS